MWPGNGRIPGISHGSRPWVLVAAILLGACAESQRSAPVLITSIETVPVVAGEPVTTAFELSDSADLLISVSQEDIDVVVSLVGPSGDKTTVGTPIRRDGPELLLTRNAAPGRYQLEISSDDHELASGSASVLVEALPADSSLDRRFIEAYALTSYAGEQSWAAYHPADLNVAEDSDAHLDMFRVAAEAYLQAASQWESLNQHLNQAIATYSAAEMYYWIGDFDESMQLSELAVLQAEQYIEDPKLHSRIVHLRAQVLSELDNEEDLTRALELLRAAFQAQRDAGYEFDAGITLNSIAYTEWRRGNLLAAIEAAESSVLTLEALGEIEEAGKSHNNVAKLHEFLGQPDKALASFEIALRLANEAGDRLTYAEYLENAADTHATLGHLDQALTLYQDSLNAFEEIGDFPGIARAQDGLGLVYLYKGDLELSKSHFQLAQSSHEKSGEERPKIESFTKYGNAYRELGDLNTALSLHSQALQLAKDDANIAAVNLELGKDYRALEDLDRAVSHLNTALARAADNNSPQTHAFAQTELGEIGVLAEPSASINTLQSALEEHRANQSLQGEARTLAAISRAHSQLGDLEQALRAANAALELVELLRIRAGSPRLQYAFTGVQWPTYELVIQLNMSMHQVAKESIAEYDNEFLIAALEISEKAKGRTLSELLLQSAQVDSNDEDEALRLEHEALRGRLAELAYQRATGSTMGDTALVTSTSAISELITELHVVEAKLSQRNAQNIDRASQEFDLTKLQQQLSVLDGDRPNILLEYSIGEQESVLWAVTSDAVDGWKLPGMAELEPVVREAYQSLSHPPGFRLPSAENGSHMDVLSRLLLSPVSDQLEGARLIVIPDGPLHYIPFAALTNPSTERTLINDAEVIAIPSARLLSIQRGAGQTALRRPGGIAIIADPVFGKNDVRTESAGRTKLTASATRDQYCGIDAETRDALSGSSDVKSEGDRRGDGFHRLYFSRHEYCAIEEVASQAAVRTLPMVGFEASRASVLSAELDQYQILHFATHGLVDSEQPELSAIAMSALDRSGQQIPSLLQLSDIASLKLNADLVVLSACDTALGRSVQGEGLAGLVQAFIATGARSVIATTWAVEDRATMQLMNYFYRELLIEKQSPSKALRNAQLAISADPKWSDPYYWAPFSYIGDWVTPK